jgi:hypothetical protein
MVPAGIEVTPQSSMKPRIIPTAVVEHVGDEYERTRSMRPRDYQEITFDASYLLAMSERFVDSRAER